VACALGCWLSVMALAGPTDVRAQTPTVEPGATIDDAATLEPDQEYEGAIDALGDIDLFAIPVLSTLGILRVQVTQLNATCEIWASSLDRAGTEVNRIASSTEGASIATITVTEDTVYVAIDSGPYNECTGATYSIRATEQPLAADIPAGSAAFGAFARFSAGDVLRCLTYAQASGKSGTRIRALTDAIAHASGARENRLRRALRRVRKVYRRYHRLELVWCARAGM
jgi:hypothetical protein